MKVIATVRVMVPKRSAVSVRVSITAAGGNNTMMSQTIRETSGEE